MKRQLILGLILLLLVLVAVAAYFLVDHIVTRKEEKEAEESAQLELGSFNANDVIKLDLHTPDLDYVVEQDDAGRWVVTNADVRINSYYISTLCTQGSLLTANKDLGAVDEETRESYGLTDPVSVTYYTENDTIQIYIGKLSPTKEYFYVMKEGSDHVYLADADVAGYLYVTDSQLRYRYAMLDQDSEICKFSLTHTGQVVYDLDCSSGDWKMTAPYDGPLTVNNANVSALFIDIQQLEADDFGDADKTLSEDDGYVFQFTQETGDVTTLIFEDYDPLTESMVSCLRKETGDVLVFDSSYIKFLQSTPEYLLLDTLCSPGLDEAEGLTIQYSGSFNDKELDIDDSFTWNAQEGTYYRDGKELTAAEEINAFQTFFKAAANLSYESLDADAKLPDDAEPAMTLTYQYTDGTSHEITLYRNDEKTYWACVDGAFTCAQVRQRELSGEERILETYTALLEAIASAEA